MKQPYNKPFAEMIEFKTKTAIMDGDVNIGDDDDDIVITESVPDEW